MTQQIPDVVLNDCVALVGRTGSGKSFTSRGMAERILDRGERLCIIDPTGVHWGLRLGWDGKSKGYAVVVFGGDYADVAIAETSGGPVAELVAGKNLPCVVDVSGFTIGARIRFLTAFLETLYIKNKRTPLTLIVDEADIVAPQRIQPNETVMFSRLEQIVRRGRVRGFRPWLITQRPAELHKSVLSQAATLIALKLTAPQDRKAIEGWVMGHADKAMGAEVLGSLAGLPRGEGWVWCPGEDLLQRMKFPAIKTYDSMRTPETGERHPAPASLSEVDLSGIRDSLAIVEAEAAANDPKALKRRVAELEAEKARSLNQGTPAAGIDPADYDRDIELARSNGFASGMAEGRRAALQEIAPSLADASAHLAEALNHVSDTIKAVNEKLAERAPIPAALPRATLNVDRARVEPPRHYPESRHVARANGSDAGETMPGPQRKLLTVLAQYPNGRNKKQLAILAGYSHNGGAFGNPLSNIRARKWAEGGPDRIMITPAGMKALGSWKPLPTGRALQEYWFENLEGPQAKLLRALCDVFPRGMSKEGLARATGYEPAGGAFGNPLSRLRALELATGKGGADIRASDILFDAGERR